MKRRTTRDDPAYLQAMREAKELFDAQMAKSAMKGRGRPAKNAVKPVVKDEESDEDEIPEE